MDKILSNHYKKGVYVWLKTETIITTKTKTIIKTIQTEMKTRTTRIITTKTAEITETDSFLSYYAPILVHNYRKPHVNVAFYNNALDLLWLIKIGINYFLCKPFLRICLCN